MTRINRFVAMAALAVTVAIMLPAGNARADVNQNGPAPYWRWALLVGINNYQGGTEDLKGASQDAYAIRDYLISLGWRSDHIKTLTDGSATYNGIVSGIRWLASHTTGGSTVVFHFSGHEMPFNRNGKRYVAVRTVENKFLMDTTLGSEFRKVRAARFWLDFSLCRAGGFSEVEGSGRVVTYAAPESELAYEDGGLHHSVFNYYSIVQGMKNRSADRNSDGHVTVEEAFWYSRTLVTNYTSGKQHPKVSDNLSGDMDLRPR